ncbi:MAG: putative chromosome-partitioning protein ParB [Syntrophaceae bacterium PtaB.Bin038]|nr:MAG: putative chromosome-partitioning protein ParB [Syntrophaceae bacterium PtaB.Bin038]
MKQAKIQTMAGEKITQIALGKLYPFKGNRTVGGVDAGAIAQLAKSIQELGVQVPAVVRERKEKGGKGSYEIIAGERRWRAAGIAGLSELPCVVRAVNAEEAELIRMVENMQREGIHPLDEAEGYARIGMARGIGLEELAESVGRSVSYVEQRLKLRYLIPPAKELLAKGKINAGQAVLIARLAPGAQKEVVEAGFFRDPEGVTIRELDEFIRENVMLDLGAAAFKKDDATLLPKVGSCQACSDRTGTQPSLFADIAKKDYCLRAECFQAKLDALLKRNQEELARSGKPYLQVMTEYHDTDQLAKLPKGSVKHFDWTECRQKDKGAVRCLVVDGPGRGRMTWGKKDEQSGYQPSPSEKAAADKRRRDVKTKRAVLLKIYDLVIAKLVNVLEKHELPIDVLQVIARHSWERLEDRHRVAMAKAGGWDKPKKGSAYGGNGWREQGLRMLPDLEQNQLFLFMAQAALIGTTDVNEYWPGDTKDLELAARALNIDMKAEEARIRKELKKKAKA